MQTVRWMLVIGLCLATGIIAWFSFFGHGGFSSNQRNTEALPTEKSVAILPFESLSPNKDDSYFADGVQDEILNNLAKIAQLKVISRTSVMQYRGDTKRDLRQIANALGVAKVLEGTVRRDGNHVRVSTELVDALTDNTIWADNYDRNLTDIFAIQSEIAQQVASRLSAQLSPEEEKDIAEKPTDNLEAYDLYLQAKQSFANPQAIVVVDEYEDLLHVVKLLQEAIRKDSKFALAYCLLTRAYDSLYLRDLDAEQRALGDAAVSEALRLRPDLPEVHLAAAFHLYKCYRNYERAGVQVAIAQQTLPNSSVALSVTAYIDRRKGRWGESTKYLERALSLDPRNPEFIKQLAVNYFILRRYGDCERTFDRIIKLEPDQPLLKLEKAVLLVTAKADLTNFQAALDGIPASMKDNQIVVRWRFDYAVLARDWTRAKGVLSNSSNEEFPFSKVDALVPRGCLQIWLARVQGDHPGMEGDFAATHDQLTRKVDSRPENGALLSVLGLIDAALGRKQEAINEAKRAAEMLPISVDACDGPSFVYNLAAVYALTNEANLAFDQLAILVKTPGGLGYGQLKLDPAWDPLRKDPRFDKLLAQLAPKD